MGRFNFNAVLLLSGIFLALIVNPLLADPVDVFELQPTMIGERLQNHLEYLEDPGGALTFENILSNEPDIASRWKKMSRSGPGFTQSAYWVRLRVRNSTGKTINWRLQEINAFMDNLQFFFPLKSGEYERFQTGDGFNFSQRPLRHRTFVLKLETQAGGESTLYLRYKDRAMIHFGLMTWSPKAFIIYQERESALIWLYYGFILVMLVYNLFLYFSIRDRSYLYYVLYLGTFLIATMGLTNTANQYLWPQDPGLAHRMFLLTLFLSVGFVLQFGRHFLNVRSFYPGFDRLLLIMAVFAFTIGSLAGIFPASSVEFYPLFLMSHSALTLSMIFLLAPLSLLLVFKKGSRPARYFSLAFIGLCFGLTVLILQAAGLMKASGLGAYAYQLGSTFEIVLLSLGLGDRINSMKNKLQDLNITLEKRVEERTHQLQEANDKLHELDGIKNNFFANISHEIRTPLTLILAPLEKLLGEQAQGDSEETEILSGMRRNAYRLLKLINDLLELARFDADREGLALRPVEIVAFVRKIAGNFESIADVKNIDFKINDTGPRWISIDPDKFEKVVLNVLSNAFKFTEKGQVLVETDTLANGLTIQVTDSGIGIEAMDHSLIFERFRQVESSSHRRFGGTGIGLALSREIMALHGGHITVASEPGKGAVFSLRLPSELWDPEPLSGDTSEEPAAGVPYAALAVDEFRKSHKSFPVGVRSPSELSVLVVEDNSELRAYVSRLLSHDYKVLEASNGREGLDSARKNQPALIVSDLMMPEMDGMEFLQNVKDDTALRHIPFVLLTARAEVHDKLEGLKTGADDYVTKPFQAEELLLKIKNLLQKNMVFELSLHQEREKIFRTLHDYLGGSLTDMSMALTRIKRKGGEVNENVHELEGYLKQSIVSYKRCFDEAEDLKILKEDFLEGLKLILLRRYANYSRDFSFHADDELKPLFLHHGNDEIKSCMYAVVNEIASNDLKYGDGATEWELKRKGSGNELVLEMSAPSSYPELENNPGRGANNISERVKALGGSLEANLGDGVYSIRICFSLLG